MNTRKTPALRTKAQFKRYDFYWVLLLHLLPPPPSPPPTPPPRYTEKFWKLGGSVRLASQKPYPIYDQNQYPFTVTWMSLIKILSPSLIFYPRLYSQKCFIQIYRACFVYIVLVPLSTNMAALM